MFRWKNWGKNMDFFVLRKIFLKPIFYLAVWIFVAVHGLSLVVASAAALCCGA